MPDANTVLDFIIDIEGGYVDHPIDRGGPTKFGLTIGFLQKFYPEKTIDESYVRNLSKNEAKEIYKSAWWNAYRYNQIPDMKLATQVMALSIHSGPNKAGRLLQETINDFLPTDKHIKVDGILGSKSYHALHKVWTKAHPQALNLKFIHKLLLFYSDIVKSDHSQLVFLSGWINRAFKEPKLC